MNFAAFRYFNEVAKTKSIRRAADRLHVAPSAVSRQLVQLEHSLGAPLLERTNVGIELTAAGAMVERYTQGVFQELERLQASIRDFKGLAQGEVKLCVMEGVIGNFLPRVITEFNRAYPAITFTVRTDSLDRSIEALIRNEADIAILYGSRPRTEIETLAVHREPIMALVGRSHPCAERASLSLREVCDLPLALPVQSFGLRQLFDRVVAARGLEPHVTLSTNTLELTRRMAVLGEVITIGPALSALREIEQGLCRAIPIDEPEFVGARSMICMHRDRALSFAAAEFLKGVTRQFTELGRRDA